MNNCCGLRYPLLCCALALLWLVTTSEAQAHRLQLFPAIGEESIVIHASFGRRSPAVGAQVAVHTGDGVALANGVTDEQGRFRFPTPLPQTITVVVDDGAGHREALTITRERLLQLRPAAPAPPAGDAGPDLSGGDLERRVQDLEERLQLLEASADDQSLWRFVFGIAVLLAIAFIGLRLSRRP